MDHWLRKHKFFVIFFEKNTFYEKKVVPWIGSGTRRGGGFIT